MEATFQGETFFLYFDIFKLYEVSFEVSIKIHVIFGTFEINEIMGRLKLTREVRDCNDYTSYSSIIPFN
ncbi:hypothetical protein Bca4012_025084 [Brassica carinata]